MLELPPAPAERVELGASSFLPCAPSAAALRLYADKPDAQQCSSRARQMGASEGQQSCLQNTECPRWCACSRPLQKWRASISTQSLSTAPAESESTAPDLRRVCARHSRRRVACWADHRRRGLRHGWWSASSRRALIMAATASTSAPSTSAAGEAQASTSAAGTSGSAAPGTAGAPAGDNNTPAQPQPNPLDSLSNIDLRRKLEQSRKDLMQNLAKKKKIDKELVRRVQTPLARA